MEPNTPAPAAPEAAPVAPITPVAPVAPAAPVAPVAPVTPPAPTPEETAAAAEADEWANAAKEVFPDKPTTKKDKADEQPKPEKTAEEIAADEATAKSEKLDEGAGDGDDAKAKSETNAEKDTDSSAREARAAARQSAEQTKAVAADVRTKMFAELPDQLQDADGDPIHTIEDVQKLMNPRTGEAFTEEEAGMWLLSAQQKFNLQRATTEKQIEQITDTNVALKDEADYITEKYAEVLKDEALRDKLWAQYEKTLVKDEASGVIIKAPVSLEEFYEIALSPRMEVAQKATETAAAAEAAAEAATAAEAKKVADAETARQQTRADRSDIYAPPVDPKVVDKEADEWGAAAKEVFGNQIK